MVSDEPSNSLGSPQVSLSFSTNQHTTPHIIMTQVIHFYVALDFFFQFLYNCITCGGKRHIWYILNWDPKYCMRCNTFILALLLIQWLKYLTPHKTLKFYFHPFEIKYFNTFLSLKTPLSLSLSQHQRWHSCAMPPRWSRTQLQAARIL